MPLGAPVLGAISSHPAGGAFAGPARPAMLFDDDHEVFVELRVAGALLDGLGGRAVQILE